MNKDIMKVKLGDIIGKVISGEWGEEDINNSGIYVIRTTNFTNNGTINFDNIIKRKINKHNISSKFLLKGDIIIEKSGGSNNQPVGRVVFFDYKENTYLFNNFTGLLRIRDNNKWHHKFVFYKLFNNWQIGNTKFFENKTTGIRNLKLDNYISSIEIPLLPIEEQKKIANILDKVTSLISLRKEQLKKLDELIKSRFIEMFGDPVENKKGFDKTVLKEIGSFKNGINYNTGDSGYIFKCIGVVDFKNSTILNKTDNLNIININKKPNDEYFLKKNDIVFVRSNGSQELIGRTLLIDINLQEPILYSGFCIRLRVKQRNINNIFLLQLLNIKSIKDYIKNNGHGCNIKSLNQTIIGNIPIPLPPLELQNKFASFVEEVEKNKEKVNNSLNKLETLKNALMQKYFG